MLREIEDDRQQELAVAPAPPTAVHADDERQIPRHVLRPGEIEQQVLASALHEGHRGNMLHAGWHRWRRTLGARKDDRGHDYEKGTNRRCRRAHASATVIICSSLRQ